MLCKNMTKSRKSTKRYKEIHKTQNEMIPTAVDYVVLQCVLIHLHFGNMCISLLFYSTPMKCISNFEISFFKEMIFKLLTYIFGKGKFN